MVYTVYGSQRIVVSELSISAVHSLNHRTTVALRRRDEVGSQVSAQLLIGSSLGCLVTGEAVSGPSSLESFSPAQSLLLGEIVSVWWWVQI